MRLRRLAAPEPVVAALVDGEWRIVPGASDVLEALGREPSGEPVPPGARPLLPFAPRSLRAFSVYAEHAEQSARVLVRRFFPPPARLAVAGFERVTRRTFPALKPGGSFREQPAMYVGNHTAVAGEGETVAWPSHTDRLDFELELGFVLAREVADCTPEEGAAAIGGFFVVNDWSARDVQADEYRNGMFGPAVKAKSFATSFGADFVTADELLGREGSLRGTVRVNGELWSETSTAGACHGVGELVAFAARGERLGPGDAFAGGTLPRGCGMELDRWLQPGDSVELELEGVGALRNAVGRR